MEFTKLFAAIAMIMVGFVFMFGLISTAEDSDDNNYNYSVNQTRATNLISVVGQITDTLNKSSIDAGASAIPESGAGFFDVAGDFLKRAGTMFATFGDLLGLTPDLVDAGASYVGVPEEIRSVAQYVFIFAFSFSLAILVLLGVKFIGRAT